MLLSWLRQHREQGQERKRPTSFRPVLESLDSRVVPAAHFNYANSAVNDAGALVVSFKEAGLGSNISQVEITVTAQVDATYVVVNKAGNLPNSPNFTEVSTAVSTAGLFNVSNGTTGDVSITVDPVGPTQGFLDMSNLKNGQSFALFSVSFTQVTLADAANGVFFGFVPPDPSDPLAASRTLFSV
jgi:hypothetical protein